MMRWRSEPLMDSLGVWTGAWDALNDRHFDSHPMLSSRFVNGLLRNFPAPGVRICIGESDGEVCALCLVRRSRLGVWSSYLPSQAQISPSLLIGRVDVSDLMRGLPLDALQLDLLCLDPQFHRADFSGTGLQRAAAALTMTVELNRSDEDYWSSRSKKLRDNLRRYERTVTAAGLSARYAVHADPAEVEAGVTRYAELESRGWKGRQGTALAPGNLQHHFYSTLMKAAAASGQAWVIELWFDDRLAASRLLLGGPSMVVALKTGYDEAFKAQAPGRLLLRNTLQHAHTHWAGRRFEFYTDATPDQLSWAGSQRELFHLSAFRNQIAARLATARRRWRERKEPAVQVQPESAPGASSPSAPD